MLTWLVTKKWTSDQALTMLLLLWSWIMLSPKNELRRPNKSWRLHLELNQWLLQLSCYPVKRSCMKTKSSKLSPCMIVHSTKHSSRWPIIGCTLSSILSWTVTFLRSLSNSSRNSYQCLKELLDTSTYLFTVFGKFTKLRLRIVWLSNELVLKQRIDDPWF